MAEQGMPKFRVEARSWERWSLGRAGPGKLKARQEVWLQMPSFKFEGNAKSA